MTLLRSETPPADLPITEGLVRELVATQFPEYAGLEVHSGVNGWDNAMFRLGDRLTARLPRRQMAADLSATELDWLGRVGAAWTFAAPLPVAVGAPGQGYPWRWSILPWIEGTPVLDAPLSHDGAADLGAALAQAHVPAPEGAPLNPFRSAPLSQRLGRAEARVALLAADASWRLDGVAVLASVASADAPGAPAWCHLDLHGNNVLSIDGRLAGIIDWGDAGAGDPATDLGQAAYLVGPELFASVARGYVAAGGAADPFAPRVRAEAAYYAITMASLADPQYAASGWAALHALGLAEPR